MNHRRTNVWLSLCGLSLAVIALSLTASARAQERGPGWEFGMDVIWQDSKDLKFDGGTTASLDDDIGLALTFNYRFNQRFELGFSLDWSNMDYSANLRRQDLPNVGLDVEGELESFTPRVIGTFNFIEGPLTPFITAAVGWAFTDTNIPTGLPQTFCWWDPWWGPVCAPYQNTKDIDEFVYDLGVGARWDVSPGYTLKLAYEKHWWDYSKASSTPDFDQVKFGLSYRF